MAELKPERRIFEFREVVEMMLRRENIREGKWVLAVEFGIGAINVAEPGTTDARPAAIVPIVNMGILRNDKSELENLAVDASTLAYSAS
ncbi:MAG: hypothetical protein QOI58_306 [Thermoanaerobaculia bacterium]|jgi:hypothetical protein|nr:hypothetical protein [Thermoanaerobaculia bacterium]